MPRLDETVEKFPSEVIPCSVVGKQPSLFNDNEKFIASILEGLRVTLVYPPESQLQFTRNGTLLPPLGLAYLGAVLRDRGAKVTIVDLSTYEKMDLKRYTSLITNTNPEVTGFTTLSYSWHLTKNLISEVSRSVPTKIVIGGPHVTAQGGKLLTEVPEVDFAILGDAEESLPQSLEADLKGKSLMHIPGAIFRKGSSIATAYEQRTFVNIDKLPHPAWEMLDLARYRSSYAPSGALMPVMASRGCPYSCTYCGIPISEGKALRYRAPESVVAELEWLENDFGRKDVVFNDNVFTINRNKTKEILQKLIERRLSIRWMCSTRVDLVDKELLQLMHDAGCFRVYFGIESGSMDVQKKIRKGLNLVLARDRIRVAQSVGISVEAGFIIGFPFDTKNTIKETIEYAHSLSCDHLQFSFYLPLPATGIFETYLDYPGVASFSDSGFHKSPAVIPPGMTSEELKGIVREAYEIH